MDVNLVRLQNGNPLFSEDGEICLQNKLDGSLHFVKPTKELLENFGYGISEEETVSSLAEKVPTTASTSNLFTSDTSCSSGTSGCNKRVKWSKDAILSLINLRIMHDRDFKSTCQKNEVTWKIIAEKLQLKGMNLTGTQCHDKWRYLKAKYTAVKDNRGDRGSGEERIDFPYFDEMNEFLGKKHNIKPVAIASSMQGNIIPSELNAVDTLDVDEISDESVKKRKKITSETTRPAKRIHKSILEGIWEEMKNVSKDREANRERRHQEILNIRNRAIDVFAEKMDLLLKNSK